jgi:glutamate synthase (NADPH/NADH) small chain
MSDITWPQGNPKYAWRELERTGLPKRSAAERAADFLEIYGPYDEAEARAQASRCLQCPEPGCVCGCPLSNRIPEWLALTAEGHFLEAAGILASCTSLPEVCVRLCPKDHLCEGACILSGRAEPVSIGAIEQFLMDYALAHEGVEVQRGAANGLRVAVIGGGPAGLACADALARSGFGVTVFDRQRLPEGLAMNGIPAFKLHQSVVQRRVELLQQLGVEFRAGQQVGENLSLSDLLSHHDAVYLAINSRQARRLDVPGIDLPGIAQALPFIIQMTSNFGRESPPIEVAGRRVTVLGGGDTAMDCARTAIRGGAREVCCVYRRDEASLRCGREDFENAAEEGARFLFQAAPVAFLPGARGQVSRLRLMRTEPQGIESDGRTRFEKRPGSEFEIEVDQVFLALGFEPAPLPPGGELSLLATREDGTLVVDEHQMTSQPGVFAGGDLVRSPCPTLHAVRDARNAAAGIRRYLSPRLPGG